jgi:LysR family transcriptional regulator, low CO2-responsive transcriptional regulator
MFDPIRQTTMRQLQIFLSAAEHSSFARAAQVLHLSPPAVSMQMRQLAESIGVDLFERHGRRVVLTRAGEMLLPYFERVARVLREAGEAFDSLKGLRHGKLRIGLVTTTRYFAPRLLVQFRREHPEIVLDVNIADRDVIIGELENHQVDLAIMGRPPSHLPMVVEAFAKHPHGIIAAADHPLVSKRLLAPRHLASEAFIAREHGSGTRHAMDQYFSAHGLKPPIVQEMTSNESIKQAVMAGMGLAFISLHTIILEHQTGHLALLDVKGLPVERAWYVLHRAESSLSPAATAFKAFVHQRGPSYMAKLLPRRKLATSAR